jgi:uncharacterized coiled-coil protein SlyX
MPEPTNQEIMLVLVDMKNDLQRVDAKIDAVYRKLDAKIDQAVEDMTVSFNTFATDTNRRLTRLESQHV